MTALIAKTEHKTKQFNFSNLSWLVPIFQTALRRNLNEELNTSDIRKISVEAFWATKWKYCLQGKTSIYICAKGCGDMCK